MRQKRSLLLTEKPSQSTVSGSHSRCCTSNFHSPRNFGNGALMERGRREGARSKGQKVRRSG
eukprot:13193051-Alexandrium_andersonii.AAC.1